MGIKVEVAICPNCNDKGLEIPVEQADYSKNHLVCPKCGDEFEKTNP